MHHHQSDMSAEEVKELCKIKGIPKSLQHVWLFLPDHTWNEGFSIVIYPKTIKNGQK